MGRLIDADELCKGRVENDPVRIAVECAPTVDAVPVVHGRWILTKEPLGWQEVDCVECSVCHESWVLDEEDDLDFYRTFWRFCPNCGNPMDLGGGKIMKIKTVDDERILFDNGMTITYDHFQDCCEANYAKFDDLDALAYEVEFDENLEFEAIDEAGFRFGNSPQKMFFVPCYSDQSGYYSSDVDIYFNGNRVLNFECQENIY